MIRAETAIARNHARLLAWGNVADAALRDAPLVDYTTASIGWRLVGHLVGGHRTTFTLRCPKCGRVGVSATGNGEQLVVHRGRARDDILHVEEYCEVSSAEMTMVKLKAN